MRGEHFYVHRVVARAFLGLPPSENTWQVHHKDGNRGNNNVNNLEYVTCSQNSRQSYATGTRRCSGPAQSKPIVYRAVGTEDWTRCASMTLAASELGVSTGAVSQACRRKTPLKGYEVCVADLPQPKLKGEKWRPMLCPVSREEVPGRMVSSLGRLRLRSGRIHTGLVLNGYPAASYSVSIGPRLESVHRLVALAFLGPPPSSAHTQVNHKDGDKQNNAVTNLEYVTPAENVAHYWKNKSGVSEGKWRSSSKPVWSRAYKNNDKWTWHPSMTSAAKVLGLNLSSISLCVRGIRHHTGGYAFRGADIFQALPGEEWRDVDVASLAQEKRERMQKAHR